MKRHLRFTIYDLRFSKLVIFLFTSAVSFLASYTASAQPYWNEWIDFSKKYVKITVASNSIYRLGYVDLSNEIPISAIDPRKLQLFYRGQEQHIYVFGQADSSFDIGDYIEFYGQKNDGSLDSTLYKGVLAEHAVRQPNPYYSLFSDTSSYFLTWSTSAFGKRIADSLDVNYPAYQPSNYFMKEDIIENHTDYYYGISTNSNIPFPDFHEVEGWSGYSFGYGGGVQNYPTQYSASFNTSKIYSGLGAPPASLLLAVMGVSNQVDSHPNHIFQIKYKNSSNGYTILESDTIDGYVLFKGAFNIPAAQLNNSAADIVVAALTSGFTTSHNTVPYLVLKYPHNLDLAGSNGYSEMYVPDDSQQTKSYFTFTNFSAAPAHVYDLTNHRRIPVTANQALIANSGGEKFCVLKSDAQYLTAASIKRVNGTGTFTDYRSLALAQ